jgi:excisionase family DNA binding protein
MLSVSDVAVLLKTSSAQVRTLLEERKIFHTKNGKKVVIPNRAVETYLAGLPPMSMVEENISHYKSTGGWDDDMETAANNLRVEWAIPKD